MTNINSIFIVLFSLLLSNFIVAQTPFVTTWKTDNIGTSEDNQITIPTIGSGYNYDITWGDGNTNTGVTGTITHTYASAGTYTVSVNGNFPRIYFNHTGDNEKILTVEQWGDIQWTVMENAFTGCSKLTVTASDVPNLTMVTNMTGMFENASSFNQSIDSWDVSNVTTMSRLFSNASSFNQPLGSWDVSEVTNMASMFRRATSFNQPINSWDVGNVSNMLQMFQFANSFNQTLDSWNVVEVFLMQEMFNGAVSFNQPLDNWQVGNVINMQEMFYQASSFNGAIGLWNVQNVTTMKWMFLDAKSFNQPINNWNVSEVRDMIAMFFGASAFNQPLNSWNAKNVTNMNSMFRDANAFDQPLNSWDVSSVTSMRNMFDQTTLSTENYETTLSGWSQLPMLQTSVNLGAQSLTYCQGDTARQKLLIEFNWVIEGDKQGCPPEDINLSTSSITENEEVGTVVGEFTTIDANDSGLTYVYSLVMGDGTNDTGNLFFEVSENKLITSTSIDFESEAHYFIYVRATNEFNDFFEKTFSISVVDVDEEPNFSDQILTINENSQPETEIGTVIGLDPEGNSLSYAIVSGNDLNGIKIDAPSGKLTVLDNSVIDFESNPTFILSVEASDGELNSLADITINLLDINETPILQDQSFTVPWNSKPGTIVGALNVTDPENDDLGYEILSGNTENSFSITGEGEIVVLKAETINSKLVSSFDLLVEVSDGELSSSTDISVNVDVVAGLKSISNQEIVIHPNPVSSFLNIDYRNLHVDNLSIEVVDLTGHVLVVENAKTKVDVSNLRTGTYILRIKNGKGLGITKFVKE